jgi:hypothetical protein
MLDEEISGRIDQGIKQIASKKNPTAEELTVLLLRQRGRRLANIANAVEPPMKGVDALVAELRYLRQEVIPLLDQTSVIADIKARLERTEARLN